MIKDSYFLIEIYEENVRVEKEEKCKQKCKDGAAQDWKTFYEKFRFRPDTAGKKQVRRYSHRTK